MDGEGLLRDGSETVPAVPGSWSNRPRRIETESEAFPGRVSLCFLASVLLWPFAIRCLQFLLEWLHQCFSASPLPAQFFFWQFAACKSYWGGSARVADHESCDDSSRFWRCLKFLPTKTSKSKTFGSGAEIQFWSRFWSREEKS
jgi:hypothetical protein